VNKTNETLYQEKRKRLDDVISLRQPDRVPIWFQDAGIFPPKYAGISAREAMYDADKAFAAYKKACVDFDPDLLFNPAFALHTPGDAIDIMDCRMVAMPGSKGVPVNHSFQFIEAEYMKQDEYDEFLNDATAFTITKFLPRVFGSLAPLGSLPPITNFLFGYAGLPITPVFITEEVLNAMEKFLRSARLIASHAEKVEIFSSEMKSLGFPIMCGGATLTPFDVIGDFLRGMNGILLDMYRCPEKLLAAMDRITPLVINSAIASCRITGNPSVFIALHRGSDAFMSLKQFESFYWPGLKKVLLALIDEGLTPCPFFEGDFTKRLGFLRELPKGKILGLFDKTDVHAAKEALGNVMAMSGFMPVSILQTGTREMVREYAKKLIDILGKGGGFIMGPNSVLDEANPELVKEWFDFTKSYRP
jgi:uroporphyrinogen-III decarboxylase